MTGAIDLLLVVVGASLLITIVLALGAGAILVVGDALVRRGPAAERRLRDLEVTDITHREPPVTASLAPWRSELVEQRFQRFGEVEVRAKGERDAATIWVLQQDDGAMLAELLDRPRLLTVTTPYAAGEGIETSVGRDGGTVVDDGIHIVSQRLLGFDDALDLHRVAAEPFVRRSIDGPIRLTDMAGYLEWEREHRRRFAAHHVRSALMPAQASLAWIRHGMPRLALSLAILAAAEVLLLLLPRQ